jgi:serine/threonine protein kinase
MTVSLSGTFAWAAPEVLTNERCTEKADIFSFGKRLDRQLI